MVGVDGLAQGSPERQICLRLYSCLSPTQVVDLRHGSPRPYLLVDTRCAVRKGQQLLLDYGQDFFRRTLLNELRCKSKELETIKEAHHQLELEMKRVLQENVRLTKLADQLTAENQQLKTAVAAPADG